MREAAIEIPNQVHHSIHLFTPSSLYLCIWKGIRPHKLHFIAVRIAAAKCSLSLWRIYLPCGYELDFWRLWYRRRGCCQPPLFVAIVEINDDVHAMWQPAWAVIRQTMRAPSLDTFVVVVVVVPP
jgi:hypothetical protein